MLKGANKRSLKVVSNARIGVPTSLNKEGEAMVDFSGLFKHLHKTKFVHISHWLPGAATVANVTKPGTQGEFSTINKTENVLNRNLKEKA